MPAITITDLSNAQLDVNTIASVATSPALTVTDRLGNTKNTLSGINAALLASAAAVQGSIGYLPPAAYAAGISLTSASQTVSSGGVTYAPIVSQLPFTTSGTFETAKFRVIQGVTGGDLASSIDAAKGPALVGWGDTLTYPDGNLGGAFRKVQNVEVRDDFSVYPDGTLAKSVSGHTYLFWPATGAASPRVISGKLTYTATVGAGYASVKMDQPVVKIGARFCLGAYSTPNGVVTLVPWKNDIGASYDASLGVPATPFHLSVGATQWQLATWPGANGPIQYIGSGTFITPLIADGVTPYTVEGWIDYLQGVIILSLPDGSMVKVTNTTISANKGYYPCIEEYRYTGATDSQPAFYSWWAESARPGLLAEGYRRFDTYTLATKAPVTAVQSFPATDASFAMSGTLTDVPGTGVFFIVPKSLSVLIRVNAFVDITADGLIFLAVYEGATERATMSVGTKVAHGGAISMDRVVTLPAGLALSGRTWNIKALAATGAATLKLHTGGADAFSACLSITPL